MSTTAHLLKVRSLCNRTNRALIGPGENAHLAGLDKAAAQPILHMALQKIARLIESMRSEEGH